MFYDVHYLAVAKSTYAWGHGLHYNDDFINGDIKDGELMEY